jgi:hypothetical protein
MKLERTTFTKRTKLDGNERERRNVDKNESGTPGKRASYLGERASGFAYYFSKCTCIACRCFVSKASLLSPRELQMPKERGDVYMYALHITCMWPRSLSTSLWCMFFSSSNLCLLSFFFFSFFLLLPFASAFDRIRV